MKYNIHNEYINIENYSPFSHINEVSIKYQKNKFLLPIVNIDNSIVPIHPNTFEDLKIEKNKILFYIPVYPTASYRTVYYKNKNVFIKLPLLRKITRGIRNLPKKELDRSKKACSVLKDIKIPNFNYLKEIPVYNKDENFNYIIRLIPKKDIVPLFTIIKEKRISKDEMILLIKKMVDIWLELASKNIYLEFHTQNVLIDSNNNVYYRDLSDVRSIKYNITPSYDISENELMALSFDKTFCMQNIDHILNYYREIDSLEIIKYIKQRIKDYNLQFPNYSLIYDAYNPNRVPIKVAKIKYR